MKQIPKPTMATAVMAVLIFSTVSIMPRAFAQEPSFINIDLSGTAYDGEFPYGIDCTTDPDVVFVTIYDGGALVPIDKETKEVLSLIDDPDGAASGQKFYSVTGDDDGNLYTNDFFKGTVMKYDPVGDSWTTIPIVENLDDPDDPRIEYPEGFENRPNRVRFFTPSDGVFTYTMGLPSHGGVVFANGNVYVGIGYNKDFHDPVNDMGIDDLSFAGLAKIDPDTNAMELIALSGALAPTGIAVDGTDLWISDLATDQIFRFDTVTETVTDTITLDADSAPRGLDVDSNYVYVALNKERLDGPAINSEIVKIEKADTSNIEIIDTTAPIDDFTWGTFTVFVANNKLFWTDQSAHVGVIDLATNGKVVEETSFASSNHFGCQVGDEFWWAGEGSAVVGTLSLDVEIPGEQASTDSDHTASVQKRIFTPLSNIVTSYLNATGMETESRAEIPNIEERLDYLSDTCTYIGFVSLREALRTENLSESQVMWLYEQNKQEIDSFFAGKYTKFCG